MDITQHTRNRRAPVPQSQPLPNTTQVPNSAGGYVWEVDKWVQLMRFLVLGTERGTYYISEGELTRENVAAVEACIAEDPARVLGTIAGVTEYGLALKQDARIYAFALLCATTTDDKVKASCVAVSRLMLKTAAQLFTFVKYSRALRGNGRSFRRLLAHWYLQDVNSLGYQLIKYPARDGYTHRDLLRFAHVRMAGPEHVALYRFARAQADGTVSELFEAVESDTVLQLPRQVQVGAIVRGSATTEPTSTDLHAIADLQLPREVLPTAWLNHASTWRALLANMPMTALVRNLGNLTKHGVLQPFADDVATVCARLRDPEQVRKSKLHPMQLLAASYTYAKGSGVKGSGAWAPVTQVVDALHDAFHLAFQNVMPSGKRILVGVDVSGSMMKPRVLGMDYLSAAQGAAVMAVVIAATEPNAQLLGFDTTTHTLPLTGRSSLQEALALHCNGGGTDCALPMQYAAQQGLKVDAFVILTDNETWQGHVHPAVAVEQYRQRMGMPDTRLAVVAMVDNRFTIGAPNDARCMDFCGFDPSAPAALAAFLRGTI